MKKNLLLLTILPCLVINVLAMVVLLAGCHSQAGPVSRSQTTSNLHTASRETFVIASITTQPGTISSGNLDVPRGSDKGTVIPITIIHGSRPGPVLSLIAGIHGSEYAPILALQRFRKEVDPKQLAGTIIIVHIANVPAFLERSIYVNPVDDKNLNRVFPGSAGGTLSERIAHELMEHVVKRATYVMDIHCGDGNESLCPFLLYTSGTPDPGISARSKQMAEVFGIENIWIIPYGYISDEEPPQYCDYAAVRAGKPTLLVESGERGNRDEESIANIVNGIWNVIYDLKMAEGAVRRIQNHVEIVQYKYVESKVDGIFYPLVGSGDNVNKGEQIGYTTDFFGNRISESHAPINGFIMHMIETPPVRKGDDLFCIGSTQEQR